MKSKIPAGRGQGLAGNMGGVRADKPLASFPTQVNPRQRLLAVAGLFLPPSVAERTAAAAGDPSLAASCVRTVQVWWQNQPGTEAQRKAFVILITELLHLHANYCRATLGGCA